MTTDEIDDSSAPLLEHLAELRTRLIYSVMAFIAGVVICYTVANPIFNFLTRPICVALADRGQDCSLTMIKLQEGFFVAIRISALGGFVLAFPVISYQLWRFVAPGLYKNERGAFLPFLLASPAMFLAGAAFAYYVILPMAFSFFLSFQQGAPQPMSGNTAQPANTAADHTGHMLETAGITFHGSIAEYLALTTKFIVAFGLCFQLPVLLTLMGKAGLVTAEGLGSVRKYAVVAILILAAVITPPDVVSQVILFTVIYGLYEVSIFLVRRVQKKREEELREQGLWFDDDDEAPAADPASTEVAKADGDATDETPARGRRNRAPRDDADDWE
ncbi:preprotein translocase subunit TatC [Defluviimonas sp. 20V17]|uniref:Sec-independent protein translocase protein TatC n=1 Tax=Allgaiera indica TaxID=765699 RepID=A0AAN4ZYG0_9RHOB|nr:twin-arginine translocase subunit TatC [Allgaiera indica]KDB04567.1 preprotein translocase subunit TatC [Defluviimonas sp. 20V17]GHD99661.1 Sec-independent protein translocase protein TatC [Allgaiera indica]SDW20947.1 sec-independent protein translocase protein TatC [Allgaiera indica]